MCNEIHVPKDAFIVENENTDFVDAVITPQTAEKYSKYYYGLLQQGYSKDEAKQKADKKLEQSFEIYMSRYYNKFSQTYEK